MRGDRTRDMNGELRRKRGDTHAGTIERKYDIDLGVRSDAHLETVLKRNGAESLNDLLDQ